MDVQYQTSVFVTANGQVFPEQRRSRWVWAEWEAFLMLDITTFGLRVNRRLGELMSLGQRVRCL